MDLVRLWMHEGDRVYRDKLVEDKDMENYDRIQQDITKKIFEVCFRLFSYALDDSHLIMLITRLSQSGELMFIRWFFLHVIRVSKFDPVLSYNSMVSF